MKLKLEYSEEVASRIRSMRDTIRSHGVEAEDIDVINYALAVYEMLLNEFSYDLLCVLTANDGNQTVVHLAPKETTDGQP